MDALKLTVKTLELMKGVYLKKCGIHILVHIEKYQMLVIGTIAVIWNIDNQSNWPEPLIVLLTVIFAALALKKIIIKGNVDEDLEKVISRSKPISDWYTNDKSQENLKIAVYRKDPALILTLHYDPVVDNFNEGWLRNLYPDPKVSSHQVSITYKGGELFEKIILLVDGGRVFLPLPKSRELLETTEFDLAICQILNGQTGYDTSYYFKQSKMKLNTEQLETKPNKPL
ncbi:hypothetical protein J3369_18220 [Alteromonas sp. NFXS44]|uniref:hypothetical protein n=1 Tax=Alteromonas sp. NFXS44 TaxID=2818435 RepID=UPI0032DF1A14